MELFINWISTNWQWVASVAASLVYFILLLLFRRSNNVVDPTAYSKIIELVKKAEKQFGSGHGKEKMEYVLDNLWPLCDQYTDIFRNSYRRIVESVLETPHKKGGK